MTTIRLSAGFRPASYLQYCLFPILFFGSLWVTGYLLQEGLSPFLVTYGAIAVAILCYQLLEWQIPYRRSWQPTQEDVGNDVLNGVVSYIILPTLMEPLLKAAIVAGAAWLGAALGSDLWPNHWPMWAQLVLALLVADAGRYWAHRWSHEWPLLWRFHAVHHSPKGMYWLNSMRQHPVDRLWFMLGELGLLLALGASAEVFALYTVATAYHGFCQHANVELRLGWLNWIFSAAEPHRWHHSRKVGESNANYGNNLMIYDIIFGTRYVPEGHVGELGLMNPAYPKSYWQQLWAPFRKSKLDKLPDNQSRGSTTTLNQ